MGDCTHTSAPTDEELLQFALEADSLPAEKRLHLENCPTCQRRIGEYQHFDDALVARFYRRFCPDGARLTLYCENSLPPDEQSQVAVHVLDCPLCALEVAHTRRFLREVPAELAPASTLAGTLRRTFGVLTRQQAQPAREIVTRGETGEGTGKTWPRQYRIDSIDLSLHLARATNGEQMLLGILTSADDTEQVNVFEGAVAELYAGRLFADLAPEETPQAQTLINDLGNLLFQPVSNGEYLLLIHLPGQDLLIEQITID
ncbi:MAG TPA: hypothetical protein VF458_09635 [Ktedonobacteraceae bacterium]